MAGAILNTDLPENALVNVRHEVRIYFGDSNKLEDRLIDSFVDETVKEIHRKWHPTWSKKWEDINIPFGTGTAQMPLDFKKTFQITNQLLLPTIFYKLGADYFLRGFDTSSPRRRLLQWIVPPTSEDLAIRVHYYRRPVRAIGDTDLVDIESDAIDVIKVGAKMKYMAQKSNLDEYDRLKIEFNDLRQEYIDDDTDLDNENEIRPHQADNTLADYEAGEIV